MYRYFISCLTILACIAVSCTPEPKSVFLTQQDFLPRDRCAIGGGGGVIALCHDCTCYFSSDCSSGSYCDYSTGCTDVGKLDGECTEDKSGGVFWADVEQEAVAMTMDLWFQAFEGAAEAQRLGLPDSSLVNRALETRIPAVWHREIRDAVSNALDVAVGFDFVHERGDCFGYDPRCIGQFRIDMHPEAIALIGAVRQGFNRAIRTNNPEAVVEPLEAFWANNSYEPEHTGRCYAHGHDEQGDDWSALACQTDELTRLLTVFLER